MRFKLFTVALFILPTIVQAGDIKGTWLTDEGKARVAVEPCGANVCGKIIWLKVANDAKGKPQTDALNEDTALRARPVVGIKILDLVADAANSWKGSVYNPEDGKSYAAQVVMKDDNNLVVKGCIVGGLICEDETWKKLK